MNDEILGKLKTMEVWLFRRMNVDNVLERRKLKQGKTKILSQA